MSKPSRCSRANCCSLMFVLMAVAACAQYGDRMADGRQQLSQGNYAEAEIAFSDAAQRAEDGEGLYHSLKALADVYRESGHEEKADTTEKRAVMVMGQCLEDKMNGQWPCPIRDENW